MPVDYLSIEEAERIAGHRLDRRRKYFLCDANSDPDDKKMEVSYWGHWTTSCCGCSSDDPYEQGDRGMGCHECGYTGKRVQWWPLPAREERLRQARTKNKPTHTSEENLK